MLCWKPTLTHKYKNDPYWSNSVRYTAIWRSVRLTSHLYVPFVYIQQVCLLQLRCSAVPPLGHQRAEKRALSVRVYFRSVWCNTGLYRTRSRTLKDKRKTKLSRAHRILSHAHQLMSHYRQIICGARDMACRAYRIISREKQIIFGAQEMACGEYLTASRAQEMPSVRHEKVSGLGRESCFFFI